MTILGEIASLATATIALFALVAGYVQFVLKRSIIPPVEFDVDLVGHHRGSSQIVCEVACTISNKGTNMLIVTNVRCRVQFRVRTDVEETWRDGVEPVFRTGANSKKWFFLAEKRTFVQPGVTQRFSKPVALPSSVDVADILGSFDYRIQLGPVTRLLVGLFATPPKDLDWRKGVQKHTARRVVPLTGPLIVPSDAKPQVGPSSGATAQPSPNP